MLADGRRAIGIDSFTDYYPRAAKEANIAAARTQPGFALVEQDILDLAARRSGPDALRRLLDGADCVYHLAARAGVRASWGDAFDTYTSNNVLATQQLREACVAAEVPTIVYASSSSVRGDQDELPLHVGMVCRPRSPYGVTKLAAEWVLQAGAVRHGVLRASPGRDVRAGRSWTERGGHETVPS